MKIKKLLCAVLAAVVAMPTVSAFAMSTAEFDNGMRNGINYFNQGLYYEARDEFQWFCDANWGNMNSGQQKYALDYLGAAKQKTALWEKIEKKKKALPIIAAFDIILIHDNQKKARKRIYGGNKQPGPVPAHGRNAGGKAAAVNGSAHDALDAGAGSL